MTGCAMRVSKYSKVKNGTLRRQRPWRWTSLQCNAGFVVVAGFVLVILLLRRESVAQSGTSLVDELVRVMSPKEEPFWNYSAYSFRPNVTEWDEQRVSWVENRPILKREDGKPTVWIVTDSSPTISGPFNTSYVLLRAAKNKLDYCRLHGMKLFYSMTNVDPEFTDWWTKLPLIRMLMLQHPEVEWIWWIDSDAVLTDLNFVPPFENLDAYNLVLHGEERLVYSRRERKGTSTASFLIRNCQWSLDFIDEWASMGRNDFRAKSGEFQGAAIFNRSMDIPGDDLSGIVALLAQDNKKGRHGPKWTPKVKLVLDSEYAMSGDWRILGPKLEELAESPGKGDPKLRKPLVTHFDGCLPGSPEQSLSVESWNACFDQLDRAFDVADNQLYDRFGFEPRRLGHPGDTLRRKGAVGDGEEILLSPEDYFIYPQISEWDEYRLIWMDEHKPIKDKNFLLISGSAPKPCENGHGSHRLVRAMKNKVDFCRMNDVPLFYNMAVVHQHLIGWWSKLPMLKMMMLKYPAVEWIWWMDVDAIFTDMNFMWPFERYSGHNIIMYGDADAVWGRNYFAGINTGNMLIRNCQWSLDLLDRWASFGRTLEVRQQNGVLLEKVLKRPPGWDADDQSILVYLLITEREKWADKVLFETQFAISGEWNYWTERMDRLGPKERPFVTHFAGCKPCSLWEDPEIHQKCLQRFDIALNFADNQVLENYGLRHENLSSSELFKLDLVPESFGDDDEKEHPTDEQPASKEETQNDEGKDEQLDAQQEADLQQKNKQEEEFMDLSQNVNITEFEQLQEEFETGRENKEEAEIGEKEELDQKEKSQNDEELDIPKEKPEIHVVTSQIDQKLNSTQNSEENVKSAQEPLKVNEEKSVTANQEKSTVPVPDSDLVTSKDNELNQSKTSKAKKTKKQKQSPTVTAR